MIALLLLLAAQAADPAPGASPAPSTSARAPAAALARHVCRKAPGSDILECKPAPRQRQQQPGYRLPGYGPVTRHADREHGVTLRARATNRGAAGRNRSAATLGIPF